MRDVRDMAHLPLLSGCCDIAGFPRSANCGREFFPFSPSFRSLSGMSSLSIKSLYHHWAMDSILITLKLFLWYQIKVPYLVCDTCLPDLYLFFPPYFEMKACFELEIHYLWPAKLLWDWISWDGKSDLTRSFQSGAFHSPGNLTVSTLEDIVWHVATCLSSLFQVAACRGINNSVICIYLDISSSTSFRELFVLRVNSLGPKMDPCGMPTLHPRAEDHSRLIFDPLGSVFEIQPSKHEERNWKAITFLGE